MSLEGMMLAVMLAIPVCSALVFVSAFLRRRINVSGLVTDETGANSPARWQLLFVTVAAAIAYLVKAYDNQTAVMPELPGWFTSTMIASNAVYLTGKGIGLRAFDSIVSSIKSLWRIS